MNNFFIGLLFLFLFASCRNETSLSIQSAEDYLLVANDISCVVPLVVNASENPQYLKKLLMKKTDTSNTCASFNYIAGDTSTMLGLITFEIDFFQGCVDEDGLNKAGIIKCELSNSLNVVDAICKVEFDGFRIANDFIWGGLSIENKGFNKWKVVTDDFLLQSGKESLVFIDTLLFEKKAGILSASFSDDEFVFSSKGELNDNVTGYSHDLRKNYSCSWISKGVLEINIYDQTKQIINMGIDECDNEAVLQIGEKEYLLEMH